MSGNDWDWQEDGYEPRPGAAAGGRPIRASVGDEDGWDRTDDEHGRFDLEDDDDRLPWLEAGEEADLEEPAESGWLKLAIGGLLALAAILGAFWWFTNRNAAPADAMADGSMIAAPDGEYKVAPENPGGKTFEGTGDSSFAASEGESRDGQLAATSSPAPAATASPATAPAGTTTGGAGVNGFNTAPAAVVAAATPSPRAAATPAVAASPSARPSAAASATPAVTSPSGGAGVQVGAFSTAAKAEEGWNTLARRFSALQGMRHRVVEGRADIGTVFRLQAVTGDSASARALCDRIKAAGGSCQVVR